MSRHVNIPIFIPHLGCPNMCVFCNQRTISGVTRFDISSVRRTIDESLTTVGADDEVEIAFFGGSFTGIDRTLMISLLEIAKGYVDAGRVTSVRCSTRPDYIDHEILDILKRYAVKVIELGLQSVDEEVLRISKRGHSFEDELLACRLIVKSGFTLGGQMMIGLPSSTAKTEEATADFIIDSGAKEARIYPTVVFHDTELCRMAQSGEYSPLSEDEAIERAANVFLKFHQAGVKVIRIGLCSSENLAGDTTYYAGPNHPALGELVENAVYRKLMESELNKQAVRENKSVTVYVSRGALSKAIGQNKRNKKSLAERYGLKDIKFKEDDTVREYSVRVFCEER